MPRQIEAAGLEIMAPMSPRNSGGFGGQASELGTAQTVQPRMVFLCDSVFGKADIMAERMQVLS